MQERTIKQPQNSPQNTISGEKEKKQEVSPSDLGLSSAVGLLTPDNTKKEEQTPLKGKKKKPKRGLGGKN